MRWPCAAGVPPNSACARLPTSPPCAPRLTLGSDLEFLSRPEWTALKQAYGLAFGQEKSFKPTFMYRALEDGQVDVISAFSSDGRIAAERAGGAGGRQARHSRPMTR